MISLVKNPADAATSGNSAEQKPVEARRLHRLRSVRQSEHVSRRAMAIRLKTDVQSVIQQEESADLLLSTLHQWQAALHVPVEEFLVETETGLSPLILKRSRMLRLMKTAISIVEQADQLQIRHLGQNLVDQILEIMPELAGVEAWPSVGQRCCVKELGQAARRYLSDDSTNAHDG